MKVIYFSSSFGINSFFVFLIIFSLFNSLNYEMIIISFEIKKYDMRLFFLSKISIKNLVSRTSIFICYMTIEYLYMSFNSFCFYLLTKMLFSFIFFSNNFFIISLQYSSSLRIYLIKV